MKEFISEEQPVQGGQPVSERRLVAEEPTSDAEIRDRARMCLNGVVNRGDQAMQRERERIGNG